MNYSNAMALTLSVVFLTACGGGGGGGGAEVSPFQPVPTVPPATPPVAAFSVLTAAEAPGIKDAAAVYAVEENRVLQAAVVTYDLTTATATGAPNTFAGVNADIDDADASVPEINAHLTIDGIGGYADDGKQINATLRLRGHSSRLAAQKSYRIKLANSAAAWRGEKTLQFNKHPYDLARFRNKLAFDLFRDIPHIPSLRTQFVKMSITNKDANGAQYASSDFGLFTHVEKMGKEYLAARGLPTTGNIYKAEDFDFQPNVKLALDQSGKVINKVNFELVLSLEADNNNHQKLVAMLAELNSPTGNFDTIFARYFDRGNYLTWLATSILFGNRDTINQNFALYQPLESDKFYFLPWDYDGAFGFEDQPDQKAAGSLYAPYQLTIGNWWGVGLHKRFIEDPKNLADLKQAVNDIHDAYLTEGKIKAKVDHYKALVQPHVAVVPDLTELPVLSNDRLVEWDVEASRIASAVRKNRDHFFATLEAPMPFFQAATQQAASTLLTWDAAVDLQGDAVSYIVRVSTTPDFSSADIVNASSTATELGIAKLSPGVYYMKVTARDSKGIVQNAFDRSEVGGKTYHGVFRFEVI